MLLKNLYMSFDVAEESILISIFDASDVTELNLT